MNRVCDEAVHEAPVRHTGRATRDDPRLGERGANCRKRRARPSVGRCGEAPSARSSSGLDGPGARMKDEPRQTGGEWNRGHFRCRPRARPSSAGGDECRSRRTGGSHGGAEATLGVLDEGHHPNLRADDDWEARMAAGAVSGRRPVATSPTRRRGSAGSSRRRWSSSATSGDAWTSPSSTGDRPATGRGTTSTTVRRLASRSRCASSTTPARGRIRAMRTAAGRSRQATMERRNHWVRRDEVPRGRQIAGMWRVGMRR